MKNIIVETFNKMQLVSGGKLIVEDSTLNQLGVSNQNISKIHNKLKLKHDTEWEQLPNKREAMEAVKDKRVVVAVNEEGDAYGIGYWFSPISGGTQVMIVSPDDTYPVQTISKAFREIRGRKFKYFASTEQNQHKDKSSRRPDYSYGNNFLDKARKFEPIIKQDAAEGYKAIRDYIIDNIDNDDINLKYPKISMKVLKSIAENGFKGWNSEGKFNTGSRGLLKTFFNQSWDYLLDDAAEEFEENEKLAIHKFINYIRNEITRIVEVAISGKAKTRGKTASKYKQEREQVWNTLKGQ